MTEDTPRKVPGPWEPIFGGLFLGSGFLAILNGLGWIHLAGLVQLSLQAYYACAAAGGWLMGNVYVQRRQKLPEHLRRPFLLFYLIGPAGPYALLWALLPEPFHRISPFIPLYALVISCILFLVPYLLRNWPPR